MLLPCKFCGAMCPALGNDFSFSGLAARWVLISPGEDDAHFRCHGVTRYDHEPRTRHRVRTWPLHATWPAGIELASPKQTSHLRSHTFLGLTASPRASQVPARLCWHPGIQLQGTDPSNQLWLHSEIERPHAGVTNRTLGNEDHGKLKNSR